jgi:hypothetical protein
MAAAPSIASARRGQIRLTAAAMVITQAPVDQGSNKPAQPERPAAKSEREARLARALRDNLRRRKTPGKPAPAEPSGD